MDLMNRLSNLKICYSEINILLLGETGVGKSTFINAVANYLSHPNIKKAKEGKLFVPVASKFTIRDKHNERKEIKIGVEDNEFSVLKNSRKHTIRTYVFPINNQSKIRLIDTPGIGNAKGIKEDDINAENVFSYLSQLQELHAICFFFKPNMSCNAVFSQYCLSQFFSRLHKSCCQNIIFIFTNTRGADSFSENTITWLQKFIEDIKKKSSCLEIPLYRNIFCFDNEAFRYLSALKQGVEFDLISEQRYQESWKSSSKQCWRLIDYIVNDADNGPLRPHSIKNSLNVNKIRRMLIHFSQVCSSIAKIVDEEMITLQSFKELLDSDKKSLDELRTKLYVSKTSIDSVRLNQPRLVCTSRSCAKVYQIGDKSDWSYEQVCQDPCYLPNVSTDRRGGAEIMNCACMDRSDPNWVICTKCGCSYNVHMCVIYNTTVKETTQKDSNVEENIIIKRNVIRHLKLKIDEINKKKDELDKEYQLIQNNFANLATFLQNNAIMDFSAASQDYISYLIREEKSLDTYCNEHNLETLNRILIDFEEIKRIFYKLNSNRGIGINENVTIGLIQDCIHELFKLTHNGGKIKEFYEFQKKITSKEYVHNYTIKSNTENKNYEENHEVEDRVTYGDSKGNKIQRNVHSGRLRTFQFRRHTSRSHHSSQSQDQHSHPSYPSSNNPTSSQPQNYYSHPGGYYFPPPQSNPALYNSSSISNTHSYTSYSYPYYPYYDYSYNRQSVPSSSQSYLPSQSSAQYSQRPYDYQFKDDRYPKNNQHDGSNFRRGNDRGRGYRGGSSRGRGGIRKDYHKSNRKSNNIGRRTQDSDESSSD